MQGQRFVRGLALAFSLGILAACARQRGSLGRAHAAAAAGTLEYVRQGSGSPVVVFESGIGEGADSWARVIPEVAQLTTVFAYDRPGYGRSAPDTGVFRDSRDGLRAVVGLRETLARLGIAPPYILVGHSLGGTYVELFARTHPEEVAGVVLVDPRTIEFNRECAAAGDCGPPSWLRRGWPPHMRAEYDGLTRLPAAAPRGAPLPPVPLIVLSRGAGADTSRWQRLWIDTHRDLARQVAMGRQLAVPGTGHHIQREKPDAVVAAIREVLESARRRVEAQDR